MISSIKYLLSPLLVYQIISQTRSQELSVGFLLED